MGNSRWCDASYKSYSSTVRTKSAREIYTSSYMDQYLDPAKIQFRESRDSEKNPESTPIIIGFDVTGSMAFIPTEFIKNSLGTLVNTILERKPVTDPHMLFMGIGDNNCDRCPLQVTQFEADNVIIDQLQKVYLESGGGGNNFESYDNAWAFAALKTQHDCFEKRGEKGYIFTVGDELFPQNNNRSWLEEVFPNMLPQDTSPMTFLEMAQERYHVFHIVAQEGSYAKNKPQVIMNNWREYLDKRVLLLQDHKYIAQVVTSAIALSEGADEEDVINSWESEYVKHIVSVAIGLDQ